MENEPAIRVRKLSKQFGRRKQRVLAVRDLSFDVPSGVVFGFLGPNGAGKSTTIRMIMDLVRPTAGNVAVFGCDIRQDRTVLRRAGALIEGAAFYDFLTGRKNLELLSHTMDCYDPGQIEQLLRHVDLQDRADRPVKW